MRLILVILITFAIGCDPATIVTTNVTIPTSPSPVFTPTPTFTSPNPTTPCSSTPVGQTCNQNPTNPNPVTRAPDIVTFSADTFRINHPNIPVILRWDTSDFNATVRIDPGVGSVGPVGFAVVFPTSTTTYTLTARNNFGIAQRTLTIVVNAG